MEFQSFTPGIEVNGSTIMSVIDGMGIFKAQAEKLFRDEGLGVVVPDEDHWYDQQLWLNVFKKLAEKAGASTLLMIGMKIPENAIFPSHITTIQKGLQSINIAYHMNHRNAEHKVLYEHETGESLPGIGKYEFQAIDDRSARIVCENPYPCNFDHGIILAVARKFKPEVQIVHENVDTCRMKGFESCSFKVTW